MTRAELFALSGLGLAVGGLVSIPNVFLAVPLSVVGALLAYFGLNSPRRRVAFAGILVGATGFVLSGFVIFVTVLLVSHHRVGK